MVIDAQGVFGDPKEIRQIMRDLRLSGVTAMSMTVGAVGNAPNRLQTILDDVSQIDAWFDAYNDFIILCTLPAISSKPSVWAERA
jgi:hypothetical protein